MIYCFPLLHLKLHPLKVALTNLSQFSRLSPIYLYTWWTEKDVPNFRSILQLNEIRENREIWIPQFRDRLPLICKFGWKSTQINLLHITNNATAYYLSLRLQHLMARKNHEKL